MISVVIGMPRTVAKDLESGAERVVNRRINRDHSYFSVVEVDQDTHKSRGDLRRLVLTQISV